MCQNAPLGRLLSIILYPMCLCAALLLTKPSLYPITEGARASLEFPYQPRAELIRVGEAAELMVLSREESFVTFKVNFPAVPCGVAEESGTCVSPCPHPAGCA